MGGGQHLQLLRSQMAPLESLAQCMQQSWMCILVGPPGAGWGFSHLLKRCTHEALSLIHPIAFLL